MYDLEKVIIANTKEGVVDFEKIMATLDNDYVNPIVAKKTDKEKLSKEAVSSLVKELGIDGESIEDLKLYVKQMGGNTDEIKEANIKLQKEFDELKGNYDLEVDTRTKLETATKETNQLNLIKGLGVTDEKQIKFLQWDFNNQVTDDKKFETLVEEYAKDNKLKTNTRFVKDDFGSTSSSKDIDITEAYERLKNKR